jgi:hypothetical protein
VRKPGKGNRKVGKNAEGRGEEQREEGGIIVVEKNSKASACSRPRVSSTTTEITHINI